MLKVLMCQRPFSVHHTAFLSILRPNFTPKTIYLSINLLFTSPMLSSQDTESAQECLIHTFETFQALMDKYEYTLFESEIIRPSIWAAWSHNQLFNFSTILHYPIFLLSLNLDVNPSPISSVSWSILTIMDPCITFASHLWIQSQKCPPISLWTVRLPWKGI